MKKSLVLALLLSIITSCSLFQFKERKAIEICKKSKMQLNSDNKKLDEILQIFNYNSNSTWLDFANIIAKKESEQKFEWSAQKTNEKDVYKVSLNNSNEWGFNWEVNIEQEIVKYINNNEFLKRKYGITMYEGTSEFEVKDIKTSTLEISKFDYYGLGQSLQSVNYKLNASILNKTDKVITDAITIGKVKLIFEEKTIEGVDVSDFYTNSQERISVFNPWHPNTKREFEIKTEGIDKIYLNYLPEYVLFELELKAEDPTGYTFNKCILEIDLKKAWKQLSEQKGSNKKEIPTERNAVEENINENVEENLTDDFNNTNGSDLGEDKFQIIDVVEDWNLAHNLSNINMFNRLFDENVNFYQTTLEREKCIEKKEKLLVKYADFTQTIIDEINIEKINSDEVKCSFTKAVTVNSKTTNYPSYLILKKINEEWLITAESDLITDKNVAKQKLKK